MQTGRAGGCRDALLRAHVCRDGLLELRHLRALRHPAALDRLERRASLFLGERGLGDRDVELLLRLNGHRSLSPYTVASDARAFASARRRQSTRRRTPSRREVLALNPRTSSARFGSPTRRARSAPAVFGGAYKSSLVPPCSTVRSARALS